MTNDSTNDPTSSRKDYRNLTVGSSCNWLSTAPTESRSGRITAAACSTKDFHRLWWTPVERRSSDWNSTAAAEFCVGGITVPAARARDAAGGSRARRTQRRGIHLRRDWLKRRVTAPAAELYSFSKTRMTLRTHHDDQRRRMSTMPAVETASTRRRQLIV